MWIWKRSNSPPAHGYNLASTPGPGYQQQPMYQIQMFLAQITFKAQNSYLTMLQRQLWKLKKITVKQKTNGKYKI